MFLVLLCRVAAVLLVLSVTLGQRVFWTVNDNPLDLFAVAFVVVAMLAWFWDTMCLHTAKPYRSVGINTIGPFFTLLIALPLVGVAIGRYGVTALYSWMVVAIPLGILSLGRAARLHGLRLDRIAFAMIVSHGVYGLGQSLARVGVLPVWPGAEWDASSQATLSESYAIGGRSTGLFINANTFGYWSTGAILVGAVLLAGWRRNVAVALGVLGVVGSQSRTAWAGMALLALVLIAVSMRNGRVAARFMLAAAVLAPAAFALWASGALMRLVETNLIERLNSGLGVITAGVTADRNLSARVDSWSPAGEEAHGGGPASFDRGSVAAGGEVGCGGEVGAVAGFGCGAG